MPAQAPTIEELLGEIRKFEAAENGHKTILELAKAYSVSPSTLRKRLLPLLLDGRIEMRQVLRESPFRPGAKIPHCVVVPKGDTE